jgi:ABC-type polysaccharide/polyol phosphate export permease
MDVRVNWVGFKTLVRKEVLRVARIWVQTIVPPAITMTLYFIIFGNLIGRRIGVMDGFDYMQYIAPGLIMMSVITNSKKFDDISIIPTFVLTPLTYLGGVFYSISLLPEFWQKVSLGNPILYMVNAFRYGILGTSDINIGWAYLIVSVFVVGLFALNMTLMNRGIGIRE